MTRTIFMKIYVFGLMVLSLTGCYDVEEGYRMNYSESSAEFTVTPLTLTRGAIKDTVWFEIKAKSNTDMKTIIIESSVSGTGKTGFVVTNIDPLIDHSYGTLKRGTRELDLRYRYIVSQDSTNVKLSFSLIDSEGKRSQAYNVITVPSITRYSDVALYTNSNSKTDGFATIDGMAYRNLPNYNTVSATNQSVQESVDIIFLVNGTSAMFVAPYNGNFSTSFTVKNKTKFKRMESLTNADFDVLTNASLSEFIDLDDVNSGGTSVSNVKVGDFIGFKTDFASKNSYKYGIMRIKGLHPANVSWYEGRSYVVEMDVVTQIKK
jgi:hypothetical protein